LLRFAEALMTTDPPPPPPPPSPTDLPAAPLAAWKTPLRQQWREHLHLGKFFARWLLLSIPLGVVTGSAVALFLWSLDEVTRLRWATTGALGLPWLLYLLPVAGVPVAALYTYLGKSSDRGHNLLVDEIHAPGAGMDPPTPGGGPKSAGVPARMAPLVLAGTLITHLFGGSAGREGTAVQMGGSLAATLARLVRLNAHDRRLLLMAGIAGGFGAVFGTPLAGTIFAMEVLAIGRISYDAVLPCLLTALIGDRVCTAWGIHHTNYRLDAFASLVHTPPALTPLLTTQVTLAAFAFGIASILFVELAHALAALFKRVPHPLLRPVIGGMAVILLALLLGRDYLGLGVTSPFPHDVTILSAFTPGGASPWSWLWKILLTAVTVSSGFKGGEVTPLFFIGATLGNTLAALMGAPVDLFAGLGFVAVFAGATNTPLACTIMAVELFGSAALPHFAIACFIAYFISGHRSLYSAQRVSVPKLRT
jgi:H+/Cl- antiporter ClcA